MRPLKGFTMIELLITISIMAVLGASIMLATGSTTASAKSVNIINNMRVLKEAALMYYLDHSDSAITADDLNGNDGVKNYIDNSNFVGGDSGYSFVISDAKNWYVKYSFASDADAVDIAKKLSSRAASVGLLNASYEKYTTGNDVYLKVR